MNSDESFKLMMHWLPSGGIMRRNATGPMMWNKILWNGKPIACPASFSPLCTDSSAPRTISEM
ncbi:hypothetical protein D3C77_660910 [compost metagenome]